MNKSAVSFKMRDDLHLIRKGWHMATGIVGLGLYYSLEISQQRMAQSLLILALVAFMLEALRLTIPAINDAVVKAMGPFMRECERKGLSGFPFYALGSGLSMWLFSEKIAILSILFLVFSDPISSFFGILMGRDKILPNKSLQGSLAGFVTCYCLSLFYLSFHGINNIDSLIFAFMAGVIGAFSELLSVFVDDNLTIPVASGSGLFLLNNFIPLL